MEVCLDDFALFHSDGDAVDVLLYRATNRNTLVDDLVKLIHHKCKWKRSAMTGVVAHEVSIVAIWAAFSL